LRRNDIRSVGNFVYEVVGCLNLRVEIFFPVARGMLGYYVEVFVFHNFSVVVPAGHYYTGSISATLPN